MNHEDHRDCDVSTLRARNYQETGECGVDAQADTNHDVRSIQDGEPESSAVPGGRDEVIFDLLDPGYAVTLIQQYPDEAADILRELGYTVWAPSVGVTLKAWQPPADKEE